jgi:hypothetical protein
MLDWLVIYLARLFGFIRCYSALLPLEEEARS